MLNKKIGAIIITYNDVHYTLFLIDSVLKSNYKEIDILVVDNCSDAVHKEKLNTEIKTKFPSVALLYLTEPRGYGGACNLGAEYFAEKGIEVLLFLNNDVVLDKDCIPQLLGDLGEDIVLVGPKVYLGFSKIIYSCGGFFNQTFLTIKNRGNGERDNGQYDEREEVEFINGCAFLILTKTFLGLGGFDEKFYYYYEETDLCYRLNKAGLKILYDPKAIAYHMVSKTFGTESKKSMYHLVRSHLYFIDKHSKEKKGRIFLLGLGYIFYNYTVKFIYTRIGQILTRQIAVFKGVIDFLKAK